VKLLEFRVVGFLIFDTICCDRVVRHIFQVRVAKVKKCVKENSRYAVNERVFLLLNTMQVLKQLPVMEDELAVVVENVDDERVQSL
jgi:hypothetical protein